MADVKNREQAGLARVVRHYKGYAVAAPGANTNIISGGVKVGETAAVLRITVCLTTASVFNLHVTDGTTAYVNGLNSSTALNAGDVYTFSVGAAKSTPAGLDLTYNFQVETDGVIRFLIVDEVVGAVL